MNILFILQNYKIGGVETVTHVLANKFAKEGHNCNILSLNTPKEEEIHPILSQTIDVSIINTKTLSKRETICQLRELLTNKKIDVIINQNGHLYKVTSLIKKASASLNIKILTVLHNTPNFGLKYRYKNNIIDKLKYYKNLLKLCYTYRSSYRNSDKYILLSESFIPEFKEISRLKDLSKIIAIANPITIDHNGFKYNFEKKKKQIIFVGRLDRTQKRIERILSVWNRLYTTFPDWSLILVGDGPDMPRLKQITKDKRIKYIEFAGFKNPKPYYEDASILLLTSDFEGFGLTITESMCFGVIPIVYGSYAAAYDIISDNHSGIISKPNNGFDEDDFTNKLKSVLESTTLRKELSRNAIIESKNYSISNIYEKWLEIL